MILKDRVKELSVSSGLSDLVLDGAMPGYRPFVDVGDGSETLYVAMAVDGSGAPTGKWEHGKGIWNDGLLTLVRSVVLSNSDGTTDKISFDTGTLQVFCDVGNNSLVAIDPVTFVLSVGYANTFSGIGQYITIFGDNNTVLGDGPNIFCAGTYNSIGDGNDGTNLAFTLGYSNIILGGGSSLVAIGSQNYIADYGYPTEHSVVIGHSNNFYGGSSSLFSLGYGNTLGDSGDSTSNSTVIGNQNSAIGGGLDLYIFGTQNVIPHSSQVFLIGGSNQIVGDGTYLYIFGDNNKIYGGSNFNMMAIGFGAIVRESEIIGLGFSDPPELSIVPNNGIRLASLSAPTAFIPGSVTLDSTNVNSNLIFTAKVASATNLIYIQLHNTGGTNGISVNIVSDRSIAVQLASTSGVITSTAAQVKTAIEFSAANSLVSITLEGAGDGIVNAFESFTALSGAVDGTAAKAGTLRHAGGELYFAIADILDTDDLTNWKKVQLI
jgi:hypothetical protein